MAEGLENFLQGIGAIAEAMWVHFMSFKKVGFSDEQAMCLTEKMLEILANQAGGGKNNGK